MNIFLFCVSFVCAVDSTQEEAEEDTEDINGPDIVDAGTYGTLREGGRE